MMRTKLARNLRSSEAAFMIIILFYFTCISHYQSVRRTKIGSQLETQKCMIGQVVLQAKKYAAVVVLELVGSLLCGFHDLAIEFFLLYR